MGCVVYYINDLYLEKIIYEHLGFSCFLNGSRNKGIQGIQGKDFQ